jgi:hypothetical protein
MVYKRQQNNNASRGEKYGAPDPATVYAECVRSSAENRRLHSNFPGQMAIVGMLYPLLSGIESHPMIIFDCHLASNSSDTVYVSLCRWP